MKTIKYWVEAMRLRTLPVSVTGVLMGTTYAVGQGCFKWAPAVLCLAFAVLAQIASNFANEYFDFTAGRDQKGRQGPRRGVTEGEITPHAMRRAIGIALFMAACCGLCLVAWGGWWLIAVGLAVGLGVFAYSAGPYPLSTHGWGEVGVIVFFGLVPVAFTYYLQAGDFDTYVWFVGLGTGLWGANVLIVNNYRDMEDDAAVDKRTLCVRFGRRAMRWLYTANVLAGAVCLHPVWEGGGEAGNYIFIVSMVMLFSNGNGLKTCTGAALTPVLARCSVLMFLAAVAILIATACHYWR